MKSLENINFEAIPTKQEKYTAPPSNLHKRLRTSAENQIKSLKIPNNIKEAMIQKLSEDDYLSKKANSNGWDQKIIDANYSDVESIEKGIIKELVEETKLETEKG